MRRLFPLLVVITALPGGAHADDGSMRWTTGDIALESVFIAGAAIDWAQTRTLGARRCVTDAYGMQNCNWESNVMLGRNPSRATVDTYFPLVIVGHAAVAALLPRPYRTVWQAFWIGVEGTAVRTNYPVVGLGLRF